MDERAQIVKWLRGCADQCQSDYTAQHYLMCAEAIERGFHIPPETD